MLLNNGTCPWIWIGLSHSKSSQSDSSLKTCHQTLIYSSTVTWMASNASLTRCARSLTHIGKKQVQGQLQSMHRFGTLGVLWMFTGFKAYYAYFKRYKKHRKCLLNSPIAYHIIKADKLKAYRMISWLCWVPNIILAEYLIANNMWIYYFQKLFTANWLAVNRCCFFSLKIFTYILEFSNL